MAAHGSWRVPGTRNFPNLVEVRLGIGRLNLKLVAELAAERYVAHRGRRGGGRAADLYVLPREAR